MYSRTPPLHRDGFGMVTSIILPSKCYLQVFSSLGCPEMGLSLQVDSKSVNKLSPGYHGIVK